MKVNDLNSGARNGFRPVQVVQSLEVPSGPRAGPLEGIIVIRRVDTIPWVVDEVDHVIRDMGDLKAVSEKSEKLASPRSSTNLSAAYFNFLYGAGMSFSSSLFRRLRRASPVPSSSLSAKFKQSAEKPAPQKRNPPPVDALFRRSGNSMCLPSERSRWKLA